MRILRFVTVLLFVVTLIGFIGLNLYDDMTSDTTYPKIELSEEMLEISITSTDADLLAGVTAFDGKDGDITEKLVVESISSFIGDGICEVTYAVADSDCHVMKAKRLVHYVDYTPPRLYLSRPLVFEVGEKIDFRKIVGAIDCIDGDISDRVTFIATDYTSTMEGVYRLSVQVTSSRGDMIYLDFPVHVEQHTKLAPTIMLTENIIYVKKGETPDFLSFVLSVTQQNKELIGGELVFSTDFDANEPGMYSVDYYATADDGLVGHTILTVIVEE